MPKTTQLVLSLESKPGVLAKVARALSDAGVNITAMSAGDAAGRGKLRLVVSDPARATATLKAAKYRVTEEAAVILTLEHRPGALAGAAEKLAQARVNIKTAYATTTADGGRATVVLTVSNTDKALALLTP
ncbi:MAG: ACT domain-containing protein [Candidatus Rokuibacteriota bacterium]